MKLEPEPRSLAEPGSSRHVWKMERRPETGEEEEAEKDKAGDEKRKRMKKVREEGMSCLFF